MALELVSYPVDLINSAVYETPNGVHKYTLTHRGSAGGRTSWVAHVPGCSTITGDDLTRAVWRSYKALLDEGRTPCSWCHPHDHIHVTLPDGSARHIPMAAVAYGRQGDGVVFYARYARYAMVDRRWLVLGWYPDADTAQQAIDSTGTGSIVKIDEIARDIGAARPTTS